MSTGDEFGTAGGSETGDGPCGDGIIDDDEQCDDGGESARCNADCTIAVCGDGMLNAAAGEQCDDGGESRDCDVDCTPAMCGDDVFNASAGEQCDDAGRSDACNADCTLATCGDGILNETAGEYCDDGGESAGCNADCTPSSCGDGVTNASAGEACDDQGASRGCDVDCTLVECGDLLVNEAAGEQCEGAEFEGATCMSEGFDGGTLACDDECSLDTSGCYFCGDGMANLEEPCDGLDLAGATCIGLGFDGGVLACDGSCALDTSGCYACGDGAIDPGEQCDGAELGGQTCETLLFDGGTLACDGSCNVDTSGCYSCGDGVVNPGEQCDGVDLGGQTCESLGFDSGALGCDGTCGFSISGCYWESCEAILIAEPAATSGMYAVDIDGQDPLPPIDVYCDMDSDGGGWTELTPALGCVLGGEMIAVDLAELEEGIDAECRPFTRDDGGSHTYHYTIPYPAGFSQFMLVDYVARSNAGPGYTSDLLDTVVQTLWSQANVGGAGDISFGAAEEMGPATSYGSAGVVVSCYDCEIDYPQNMTVYTLPIESEALRIGWGESGGQHEGWYPWWAGTIRVR
ncbi:MAG: fibrinogen-like YCDxxxxGGGW domain-containing protein [Myxococcota bacterium]